MVKNFSSSVYTELPQVLTKYFKCRCIAVLESYSVKTGTF